MYGTSAIMIHTIARNAASRCLSWPRNQIHTAAIQPQIQRTRWMPRGHVIQNGAESEKLPSAKRKLFDSRVRKIEAVTTIANTAYGATLLQSGTTSQNSGTKM